VGARYAGCSSKNINNTWRNTAVDGLYELLVFRCRMKAA
jgi:hypothetical protein